MGLWGRQKLAAIRGEREPGERALARSWGRRLTVAGAILGLSIGLLSTVQLYQCGMLPPVNGDRAANFERLWRTMSALYPYSELKGADWQEIHARYAPRVAAAANGDEYFRLIGEMLAELQDAHTGVVEPPVLSDLHWIGLAREIQGQPVVTKVRPTVRIPGLVPGAVIVSREGLSVQEFVSRLPPALRSGSTEAQRKLRAYSVLLAIPPGREVPIAYRTPAGEVKDATLCWSDDYLAGAGAKDGPHAGQGKPAAPPLITARKLSSGLWVIIIPAFASEDHNLVAEFDAALEQAADAPGIILDVRRNGGGSSLVADAMAGRFFSRSFVYGHETYRRRIPLHVWRSRGEYRVRPRGRTYRGRLAVLTDTDTMSSAEMFVAALKDSGRALTVGRTTGGASGNPLTFLLPGGRVRFSTGAFHRLDGRLIEGEGISPDVPVEWSISAVVSGRDPDVEAAEAVLLHQGTWESTSRSG